MRTELLSSPFLKPAKSCQNRRIIFFFLQLSSLLNIKTLHLYARRKGFALSGTSSFVLSAVSSHRSLEGYKLCLVLNFPPVPFPFKKLNGKTSIIGKPRGVCCGKRLDLRKGQIELSTSQHFSVTFNHSHSKNDIWPTIFTFNLNDLIFF